ncbi:protein of unknown function [Burkholderia multivorans]
MRRCRAACRKGRKVFFSRARLSNGPSNMRDVLQRNCACLAWSVLGSMNTRVRLRCR